MPILFYVQRREAPIQKEANRHPHSSPTMKKMLLGIGGQNDIELWIFLEIFLYQFFFWFSFSVKWFCYFKNTCLQWPSRQFLIFIFFVAGLHLRGVFFLWHKMSSNLIIFPEKISKLESTFIFIKDMLQKSIWKLKSCHDGHVFHRHVFFKVAKSFRTKKKLWKKLWKSNPLSDVQNIDGIIRGF